MEKDTYRIHGLISAQATGEPIPDVAVIVVGASLAGKPVLGRVVTDKGGYYNLILDIKDREGRYPKKLEALVQLEDAKGRHILTRERPIDLVEGKDVQVDFSVPAIEHGLEWPNIRYIEGQPVNIQAVAQLSQKDLIEAYRYFRGRANEPERADLVRQAFPGLFGRAIPGDDCGEGRYNVLRVFLEEKGGLAMLSDGDADDLPAGATVHWFYTDKIRVKYTTDAAFPNDRVDPTLPAADQNVDLSDGTTIGMARANLADLHPDNTEVAPAYVQQVGVIAEYALTRYLSGAFSMRDPRNGAARLEYRIRQMPTGIAGQTTASWSHVEVGPNNTYIQNLHTVPHEMFHQVQYRYNNTTTRSGLYGSLREGGARLIEDSINDLPNRYIDTAQLIFSDPTQSLADSPSVGSSVSASTTIRYAAGLFWKYMAEQHSTNTGLASEPAVGIDSYRKVLEAMATVAAGDPGVGYDPPALRPARSNMPWYGHFDQFRYYDTAQTELDSHETTWGNYLIANYLHGTGNPVSDARFEYMEDQDAVTWPGSAVAQLAALQSTIQASDDLLLAQGTSISRNVTGHKAWAARYYRLRPSGAPGPRLLRINFSTSAGMTDPLIQILRLGPGSSLVDIHRSDLSSYSKTINLSGLDSVIVIVASRANPGDFSLQFDEVASASDTMVTRWNSRAATEYQIDPKGWSWTWVSPDVMVDNDNDGLADSQVFFGQDNRLKVRLRNRGNQAANNIQIDFWYQKATPYLSAAAWIPLQDLAGITQQITGATLAAGAQQWFEVNWAPVDDGTHHEHWCVKVRVTVAGEPNTDNKLALSNFSHVIPSDPDVRLMLRVPELFDLSELVIVPRGPNWLLDIKKDIQKIRRRRKEAASICPDPVVQTPREVIWSQIRLIETKSKPWDGLVRTLRPMPQRYYPVDLETLPPGIKGEDLVTIAHMVDGTVVGGVTYQIATDIKMHKMAGRS